MAIAVPAYARPSRVPCPAVIHSGSDDSTHQGALIIEAHSYAMVLGRLALLGTNREIGNEREKSEA